MQVLHVCNTNETRRLVLGCVSLDIRVRARALSARPADKSGQTASARAWSGGIGDYGDALGLART